MIVLLIGLALGALVGLTIPSLPTLVLTRGKAFNRRFPPHPEAIPVDGVLLQRVLTMGRMHQWGIAFGLLPLGFGWLILSYSSAMGLGLGLLLGGGWGSLIRTASLIDGDLSPWPRKAWRISCMVHVNRSGCRRVVPTPCPSGRFDPFVVEVAGPSSSISPGRTSGGLEPTASSWDRSGSSSVEVTPSPSDQRATSVGRLNRRGLIRTMTSCPPPRGFAPRLEPSSSRVWSWTHELPRFALQRPPSLLPVPSSQV